MRKCNYCSKMLSDKSALSRHQKNCFFRNSPIIKLKESKQSTEDVSTNQKLDFIMREIRELKETQKINNQKPSNHITINNIMITEKLPNCFYQALIHKLGKVKAVNLLNSSSAENTAVNIYKELYPSNKMSENPVIYENDTFKYFNGDKIICDNEIINEIAMGLQTAMLYASSDIITESIKINKTDQLYDIYDIGKIQDNVRDIQKIKNQVCNYIKLDLINL